MHTVTESGESDDPSTLVDLNPRELMKDERCSLIHLPLVFLHSFSPCPLSSEFPEAPILVQLEQQQLDPLLMHLLWTLPSLHQYGLTPILSYRVFLNHTLLVKSVSPSQLHLSDAESNSDIRRVYVTLNTDDFAHLSASASSSSLLSTHDSMKQSQCVLTVRACGEYYMSAHSEEVTVPSHVTSLLLPWLTSHSIKREVLASERDQSVDMQVIQGSSVVGNSDCQLLSNALAKRELEKEGKKEEGEEEKPENDEEEEEDKEDEREEHLEG